MICDKTGGRQHCCNEAGLDFCFLFFKNAFTVTLLTLVFVEHSARVSNLCLMHDIIYRAIFPEHNNTFPQQHPLNAPIAVREERQTVVTAASGPHYAMTIQHFFKNISCMFFFLTGVHSWRVVRITGRHGEQPTTGALPATCFP